MLRARISKSGHNGGMKALRVIALLFGVPVLLFGVLVAGFIFLGPESARLAIVQQTAPYLLLPVYLALVGFLITRHKALAAVAIVLIVFHLVHVLPEMFASQQGLTEAERQSTPVKVFSHNVMFDNQTPEAPAAAIRNAGADIVLLQEVTWQNWKAMEATGVFNEYPHSFVSQAGTDGLAMWSKYPLSDTELLRSKGFPSQRARTVVDNKELTIYNVHTRAPVNYSADYWYDDMRTLRNRLSDEKGAVIAAGDYNASYQHPNFRAILKAGYNDAAPAAKSPLSRTWPMDRMAGGVFGGYFRLDHILFNNELKVLSYGTAPSNGSDHKAVRASLVFTQPR